MKKNDEIILEITDYTAEGSGIGKYDTMAVFVPLTAIGDTAKVKILKVKKNYAFGKVIEIIEKSKCRTENNCSAFSRCGGCTLRHISYESELNAKRSHAYETIKRIGGIDLKPDSIIFGKDERYRNKAQYPVRYDGKAGFFATHSHRIVSCDDCFLQPEIFTTLTHVIEKWIEKYSISIYNETEHSGLLRHIFIRQGEKTKEIMVVLVINGNTLPFDKELIEKLKDIAGDRLKSVQININKQNTNVILGEKCTVLYGTSYITDILCGIKVRLSPLSFYQVNHAMAEKLYRKASEYGQIDGKTVLDLYCGTGTIGLSMASRAKKVIGVEIVPEAVKDAKFNAEDNKIKNAEFFCMDATEFAEKAAKDGLYTDVVVVDPPRKGCTPELINVITESFSPERVVYVSCDVGTLARDIKLFGESGYELREYTLVDLFPRTSHCETVALLSRQKPDGF